MLKLLPAKARWVLILLALAGAALWKISPAEAVYAVANLADPAKLETLGKRQANPRLNKIVYWLDDARGRGLAPDTTIRWAQLWNGTTEPRASLVKASLLRNLSLADEFGLWTDENRHRLRRGAGGVVSKGPHTGDTIEIDHVVPVSLAPEVGNELANLEMMPGRLNRSKSDRVGTRELEHARVLLNAGLLKQESWERVFKKSQQTELVPAKPKPPAARSPKPQNRDSK